MLADMEAQHIRNELEAEKLNKNNGRQPWNNYRKSGITLNKNIAELWKN